MYVNMQRKDEMNGLLEMTLEPKLLTDKSRLKEIYDLRVSVWENSEKSGFINRQLFPNGWYDELDEEAQHWIITDEEDKIIASARLNLFYSLDRFLYATLIRNLNVPSQAPVGLFGRLVIHPQYQGLSLSAKLISSRINYCEMNKVHWLQALVTSDRIKNILARLDFKIIGQIDVNYHEFTPSHAVNIFVKEYHYNN